MSNQSTLSRRGFLLGSGLALLGARAHGLPMGPRVVVVGAGAFGCWTALQLLRRGAQVTLVDAWGAGHSRASSGGESRVIRAIYGADRIYSEMVRRSYPLWQELDGATDHSLYRETGALWMLRGEDDSYIRAALPIQEELGFPVERISPGEAASRWPQISFQGVRNVYLERRAGVLSARQACEVLVHAVIAGGGSFRLGRSRPGRSLNGRLQEVRLDDGSRLQADAFVFCCGPWLGKLFPETVGPAIRPTRQDVLYFGVPAGDAAYGPDQLPVWIDFGERVIYGLPDVHGRGFKLADDTRGETIDPDVLERRIDASSLSRARRFLGERFPALASAPLVESRVCQYENSPDGDLIADRHPELENLWLAGGGSGHGFKLSPALGTLMSRAVLGSAPLPKDFGLARLASAEAEHTQFDDEA